MFSLNDQAIRLMQIVIAHNRNLSYSSKWGIAAMFDDAGILHQQQYKGALLVIML